MDVQDQCDRVQAVDATYRYRLRTWRDPQAIARVAGLFAQRSLVPLSFDSVDEGDRLFISVEAQLACEATAELVRRKLEALVIVEQPIAFERKD